tara:strand:- start:697 stop:1425 length:729 start_codon:yes stop_codon:yes gene_type:complete
MSTTYHPEGNRDFRRWIESGIPNAGLMGGSALAMYGASQFGGSNRNLASALMNESIQRDPRLKITNFSMRNIYSNLGVNMPKWTDTFTASYNPKTHTVNAPRSNYGILAHELGHAEQYKNPLYRKTIAPLSNVARRIAPFGVLAPILSDNEEDARKNSIAAGAMQIPTLIEEIDASRRGSNILSQHMLNKPALQGAKGTSRMAQALTKLRPFAGVPSYLFAAAAPYLMYKYMKGRELYEGEY